MRRELPILASPEALEHARMMMRAHLCGHCPFRSRADDGVGTDVPRHCEADCELIRRLPALVTRACLAEPMVGSAPRTIEARLRELCEEVGRTDPKLAAFWQKNRQQIVRDLLAIVQDLNHPRWRKQPPRCDM
jgi:hypothetical protein